jgi:hypothetical protein
MKWIPDSYLDYILNEVTKADEEVICSAAPTTYFQAIWPDLWIQSTAKNVGDCVYPPTQNGFIYECTVAGTTGSVEPSWGTTDGGTFTDGTVTWKTHTNVALVNSPLSPADKVISDGDTDGRKLTISEKVGVTTHTDGTVTHMALIEHATKTLHLVTEAQTIVGGSNDIEAGRRTVLYEFSITVRDPQ